MIIEIQKKNLIYQLLKKNYEVLKIKIKYILNQLYLLSFSITFITFFHFLCFFIYPIHPQMNIISDLLMISLILYIATLILLTCSTIFVYLNAKISWMSIIFCLFLYVHHISYFFFIYIWCVLTWGCSCFILFIDDFIKLFITPLYHYFISHFLFFYNISLFYKNNYINTIFLWIYFYRNNFSFDNILYFGSFVAILIIANWL